MRNPDLNVSGVILTSALIGFPKDKDVPFLKRFFVTTLGSHLGDIIVHSNTHPTALSKNNYPIRKTCGDKL